MTDSLDQLAALHPACDTRCDGRPCAGTGAYVISTLCSTCELSPEPHIVCSLCMRSITEQGLACSVCAQLLRLGHMSRLVGGA